MQEKITKAKELLPRVKISRDIKVKIATVCSNLNIDGLRGDLVVNRASAALVAFEGRTEVRSPAPRRFPEPPRRSHLLYNVARSAVSQSSSPSIYPRHVLPAAAPPRDQIGVTRHDAL